MQKKQASLRRKLLTWLVPLLLLLILIDSTILYRLAITKLEKELDADLFTSTKNIAQFLTDFGNSPSDILLLENASKIFLKDEVDEIIYSISDSQGRLLSGSNVLLEASRSYPPNQKQANANHDYYFTSIAKAEFRVVRAVFDVRNSQGAQTFTIQIAGTQEWRKTLSNTILIGIVVPQLLLALLSFLIVWFGVKKGLAPLNVLQNALLKR